jgi:hypothetical protein
MTTIASIAVSRLVEVIMVLPRTYCMKVKRPFMMENVSRKVRRQGYFPAHYLRSLSPNEFERSYELAKRLAWIWMTLPTLLPTMLALPAMLWSAKATSKVASIMTRSPEARLRVSVLSCT